MTQSTHSVRVYYEDTDLTGVVYHAGYLRFMERGRTEFLREHGIENGALWAADNPLAFVVAHMDIAFRAPARMDDVLDVVTTVAEVSAARLVLFQTIQRSGQTLVEATVTVATIDGAGRARRLPDVLRGLLAQ